MGTSSLCHVMRSHFGSRFSFGFNSVSVSFGSILEHRGMSSELREKCQEVVKKRGAAISL